MPPIVDISNNFDLLTTIGSQYKQKNQLKSPFLVLHELSIKCRIQMKHDTKTFNGKNNTPLFASRIHIGDCSTVYTATSKQRAKHGAALEILNKIKLSVGTKNPQLARLIEEVK
jgi:hypothetical protein